ncbi:hypothetical protein R1sor_014692 [Riccia sorocarpa]|uniref:Uncharacterized protein n=1 Tax=Riccia sorocarpa TaxID=122646 RepID=A0ABD3HA40_9MARC
MSRVSVSVVSQELEGLTDEERRALRASRFNSSSLPPPVNRSSRSVRPVVALPKVRHVDSFSDLEDEQEDTNGKDLCSGHEAGTSSSKKNKKKHKVQSNEVGTCSLKKKKKSKVQSSVRLTWSKEAKAKGSKKKKKI